MQHALGGPQDTVPFVSENRRAPDRWFAATTSWDPVRNLPDGRAAYLNGGTAIWHSFVWTFYFTVLNNLGSTQVVKDKTVNVGATFCTVLWSPLGPNVLSRSGWLGWAKKRKEGKRRHPPFVEVAVFLSHAQWIRSKGSDSKVGRTKRKIWLRIVCVLYHFPSTLSSLPYVFGSPRVFGTAYFAQDWDFRPGSADPRVTWCWGCDFGLLSICPGISKRRFTFENPSQKFHVW